MSQKYYYVIVRILCNQSQIAKITAFQNAFDRTSAQNRISFAVIKMLFILFIYYIYPTTSKLRAFEILNYSKVTLVLNYLDGHTLKHQQISFIV